MGIVKLRRRMKTWNEIAMNRFGVDMDTLLSLYREGERDNFPGRYLLVDRVEMVEKMIASGESPSNPPRPPAPRGQGRMLHPPLTK